MDRILIRGGKRLEGRVPISGAKNAALTLLPCALLTDQPLTLTNLPRLADVEGFAHLMNELGVSTTVAGQRNGSMVRAMTLNADAISSTTAPYEIVRKMRASILVLGPLLAREGEATVSLPGGCAIGNRPIDLHLKALEALGAEIELAAGYVRARAPTGGLKGGHIIFPLVSVGATENALMAAALADGETVIDNAAREPEIADLCRCLVAMGSEIEAGSYACAAGITGGDLLLEGARAEDMAAIVSGLSEAGLVVTEEADGLRVSADGRLCPLTLSTAPFPGFPTDMQAQFMAMLTRAEGTSVLTETIFENRYMHVPELARMGADIQVHGRTAIVKGVEKLAGAPVMATDLRASMGLILAGLAAEGETQVLRVYHLDRGYERLEEKLSAVGADIERDGGG